MSLNIFFLFASLLLCNCCWSEVAANADSNREDTVTPQPVIERRAIKLTDLNEDVLYIILQESDLASLAQIAIASSKLTALANDVFQREYKDFLIYLIYADKEIDHAVFKHEKRIEIYDDDLGVIFLRAFGSLIKRLRINNDFEDRYPETLKYTNMYTSNSLTHLELERITSGTLRLFKRPFKKVEELKCYLHRKQIGKFRPFNETFPQLRRFNVRFDGYYDYDYINCEFPHLEHLDMAIESESTWDGREQIEGLIRKNPQIKSFGIAGLPMSSRKYFPILNQLLPNIERFNINWLYSEGPEVRFENVRHLSVRNYIPAAVPVLFPRLESVKFRFKTDRFGDSQTFFRKHPNLTEMHICNDFQWDTNHARLVELLSEQPDLIELKLEFGGAVYPQVIVQIVENHPKLVRFSFVVIPDRDTVRLDEADVDFICEHFESDWNITKIGYDSHSDTQGRGFSMEKLQ